MFPMTSTPHSTPLSLQASLTPAIPLPFTKMHGLGNDFVMLNHTDIPAEWNTLEGKKALAQTLCDRHWGIGGDGMIIVQPPTSPDAVATFDYWNNDGTVAEMCGNGIRCFALFVSHLGLTTHDKFVVDSLTGPKTLSIQPNQQVVVNMGPPELRGEHFPCTLPEAMNKIPALKIPLTVEFNSSPLTLPITLVNMGNPHALLFVEDIDRPLDPSVIGPLLETHPAFPQKTNVEFITQTSKHHAHVVVWERGCGLTQACGTGACATAVGAILQGKAKSPVTVTLPGGDLQIEWNGLSVNTSEQTVTKAPLPDVFMTGPATIAFQGTVNLINQSPDKHASNKHASDRPPTHPLFSII